MKVHIVVRDICFFIGNDLTIQLRINMSKCRVEDSPFAAENVHICSCSANVALVSTVISHCYSWC